MTNVQNKQENAPTYVKLYDDMLSATHYRSLTTGESIKLTSSAKLVYAKMKARFEYFKSVGKGYYDTQDYIADVTGLSRKGVNSILQGFHANGIVVIDLNGRNNVYTAINSLELCDKAKAPKKAPESVSPITLYPCQGLDGIVETEALVERYSEPVEVIEKVFEDEKVIQEDDSELEWEEESDVVFIKTTPIPVPPPTPTRDPSPAPAKDPSKVYAGDYFSDYPSKFFSNDRTLGIHHPEFMSWLNDKGGEIVDRFHFMLNGVEYYIPYHQSWKAV